MEETASGRSCWVVLARSPFVQTRHDKLHKIFKARIECRWHVRLADAMEQCNIHRQQGGMWRAPAADEVPPKPHHIELQPIFPHAIDGGGFLINEHTRDYAKRQEGPLCPLLMAPWQSKY